MTDAERTVLAALRAVEPSKAVDIGHRCSLTHESLYGALVALESKGLIRVIVDHSSRNISHKQQAMWETA